MTDFLLIPLAPLLDGNFPLESFTRTINTTQAMGYAL